jgi:Ca2+-transporting ATPase
MHDDELEKALKETRVVARATPETKMRLIEAARDDHKIIAMTGDGVNDAPALHAADVGVAMGGTGTDVAREAADLVLVDDNFATIVDAVKEGRSVLGNVQKVVTYLFATNAMELVVIGVALAFMLPTPLLAVQILWLNLVTDTLPVLALATEPTHGGRIKPEHGKLLPRNAWIRIGMLGTVMGIIGLSIYFYAANLDGDSLRFAFVLLTMTSMQWWAAFSIRSSTRSVFALNPLENKFLLAAIGTIAGVTILALSGGPLSTLLHVQPLPWTTWLWVVGLGAVILIPDELWKLAHKRRKG